MFKRPDALRIDRGTQEVTHSKAMKATQGAEHLDVEKGTRVAEHLEAKRGTLEVEGVKGRSRNRALGPKALLDATHTWLTGRSANVELSQMDKA